jgi:hypothetical protein
MLRNVDMNLSAENILIPSSPAALRDLRCRIRRPDLPCFVLLTDRYDALGVFRKSEIYIRICLQKFLQYVGEQIHIPLLCGCKYFLVSKQEYLQCYLVDIITWGPKAMLYVLCH